MKTFNKTIARLMVLPLFVAASILAPFASVFDAAAAPGPVNVQVAYNEGTEAFDVSWDSNGSDFYGVLVYQTQNDYGFAFPTSNGSGSTTGNSLSVKYYTNNGGNNRLPFTPGQAYQLAVYSANGGVGEGWEPTNITKASNTVAFGENQSWTSTPASAPRNFALVKQNYASSEEAYLRGTWDTPTTVGGSPIVGYSVKVQEAGGEWSAPVFTGENSIDILKDNFNDVDFRTDGYYNIRVAAVNALNSAISTATASKATNYPYTTRSGTSEFVNVAADGDLVSEDFNVFAGQSATLNGVRNFIIVGGAAILKGTGTAEIIAVAPKGSVRPGNSPGTLTAKQSYSSQGELEVEIVNTGSYDKIVAGEEYDGTDTDAVIIGDGATLRTVLYDGWSIAQGDQFMIIDNRSTTQVDGTYENLDEGAQFVVDGITFSITYVGGDGNDVVLTALNAGSDPTPPNTGAAKLILSNPVVVAGLGIATAVALMALAIRQRSTR